MIAELRRLLELAWSRLAALLQTAPPGSLQLTGVLGLATLVAGYYHLRGRSGGGGSSGSSGGSGGASSSSNGGARQAAGASGSSGFGAAAAAARQQQQHHHHQPHGDAHGLHHRAAAAAAKQPPPAPSPGAAADTPLAAAVRARLAGVRRVTVSAPGVLLAQWDCTDLRDAAGARPDAAAVLREIARAAEVFLLSHVPDDVGAAVVAGALEAAGVVGGGPGQVAPQRLLLCGTADGKVSVVRQLEPDLHIDASPRTVHDLSRFVPQLLLVARPDAGGPPAGLAAASNVETTASLASFFNPAGVA